MKIVLGRKTARIGTVCTVVMLVGTLATQIVMAGGPVGGSPSGQAAGKTQAQSQSKPSSPQFYYL